MSWYKGDTLTGILMKNCTMQTNCLFWMCHWALLSFNMSALTHKPSALSATDVKISLPFTSKRQKICLCQKATNGWFQRSGDVLFTGGNRVSTEENGDLKNTEGQRPNQTYLFLIKKTAQRENLTAQIQTQQVCLKVSSEVKDIILYFLLFLQNGKSASN